ncbi:MAG: glycine cleavage system protein GcvH [Candidatus Tantalella remota]|nr:glycine cleavage system protein GcvH [Candidatus Tantalella remota]
MIPGELKYTKEHEWVRMEENEVVIGITDHAQSQLGDITFVELPDAGKDVKQSDSLATVESVKAASDIYAPLSGKVTEVNTSLQDTPEMINQSPYGDGWVCRVDVGDKTELDGLMDAAAYEEFIKGTSS